MEALAQSRAEEAAEQQVQIEVLRAELSAHKILVAQLRAEAGSRGATMEGLQATLGRIEHAMSDSSRRESFVGESEACHAVALFGPHPYLLPLPSELP
jgi:hypothetical protein